MDGQIAYVLIAGLILIVNGLILLWLSEVKKDLREVRSHYVGALTKVAELKAEVQTLNLRIESLKEEIVDLKRRLAKEETHA